MFDQHSLSRRMRCPTCSDFRQKYCAWPERAHLYFVLILAAKCTLDKLKGGGGGEGHHKNFKSSVETVTINTVLWIFCLDDYD